MSKGEHSRFTAEQKLEILREAEQPGVMVSEVCRRHGLAPSILHRWRAVAQGGSAVALKRDGKRTSRKDDVEVRHDAELKRLRAVIAEITAENLELKKRFEVGRFIPLTGGDESGRQHYGQRFATVEPVFANIRHNKGLDRFTLRGRQKADTQ